MAEYKVGDRVRAVAGIYEPADDHAPGGWLCGKGDLLIVRKVTPQFKRSLSVSHEDVTDCSFGVEPSEIEPADAAGVALLDAKNQETKPRVVDQ